MEQIHKIQLLVSKSASETWDFTYWQSNCWTFKVPYSLASQHLNPEGCSFQSSVAKFGQYNTTFEREDNLLQPSVYRMMSKNVLERAFWCFPIVSAIYWGNTLDCIQDKRQRTFKRGSGGQCCQRVHQGKMTEGFQMIPAILTLCFWKDSTDVTGRPWVHFLACRILYLITLTI